jgi:very-short-patch-repair endonuclease
MSIFEEETLVKLKAIFPKYKIEEQFAVRHMGQQLFFDFWIPSLRILIECQGEQHEKYVEHFHGNQAEYKESKKRDQLKREWATKNGIPILEIIYKDRGLEPMELFDRIFEVTNG